MDFLGSWLVLLRDLNVDAFFDLDGSLLSIFFRHDFVFLNRLLLFNVFFFLLYIEIGHLSLKLKVSLLTEVEPLVIQEECAFSQGKAQ